MVTVPRIVRVDTWSRGETLEFELQKRYLQADTPRVEVRIGGRSIVVEAGELERAARVVTRMVEEETALLETSKEGRRG